MKYLLSFLVLILSSCSNEPVDMDEVLFERSNQYITKDNFSPYFFFNKKVYNGPAYNRYRSGDKKEQGMLKTAIKLVLGRAGIKREIKGLQENIKKEKKMAFGLVFIRMVRKNMKVNMQMGFK